MGGGGGLQGQRCGGESEMKNRRSNCMTKPPRPLLGRMGVVEGGCQGMWGAGGREPGQSIVR